MRCELCNTEMDEDKMVGGGEFFVCEDCADREAAASAAIEPMTPLEDLQAEIATKH